MTFNVKDQQIYDLHGNVIDFLHALFKVEKKATYRAELIAAGNEASVTRALETITTSTKDTHYIISFKFDDYNTFEFEGNTIIDKGLTKEQQVHILNYIMTFPYSPRLPVIANTIKEQDEIGLFVCFRNILEKTF